MSSAAITLHFFVWLVIVSTAGAAAAQNQQSDPIPDTKAAGHSAPATALDLPGIFQRGQDALNAGRLEEAERAFRQVIEADPQAGSAYANLGVVYMRRKQWTKALDMLHHAERLMPLAPGVRLNIGLVYFRQNEFVQAIPPLESVLHDTPDAVQPRYLLGLCYFFAERWTDATATLEPLWTQESGHLPYLYVLSNAAHRAGRKDLDERATSSLVKLGEGSPEYRLFVGKYYLNSDQDDLALQEFQAAAAADAKLPFVHFNLGLAYLNKQEYAQARDEFQKDAALEPDLALNYEYLGEVYWLTNDDKNAESSYREALRRDPRRVSSHLGLAKIYQRRQKYALALAEADAAVKADPARTDAHYMRGQLLLRLGRKIEAKEEMQLAAQDESVQPPHPPVPAPELLQDPK